jgi:DeoR family suf operon transcriptional repressor
MHDVIGSLGGYRGLRAELLVLLKKAQPLTAAELAERFGLTPNALRRHLKVLEEDGVVQYQREVRGVGAPVFAYRLSEAGEGVFPRRYASVLASALEALEHEQGRRAVASVLAREWEALAAEAGPVLEGLPLPERVQIVAELLTARGYMAEGEVQSDEAARLRIHNCAMCEIAEQFPEVCDVEARELSRLLDAPVARRTHRFGGCGSCSYDVGEDAETAQPVSATDIDDSSDAGANAPLAGGLTA